MTFERAKLLYRLVSANQRLSMRRHPMFEQNKVIRWLSFLFIGFWAVYLVLIGATLARAFDDSNYEAFDWINGGMIWFLAVDFASRFMLQETPAQEVRPYKLLPVSQNFLLNVFLVRLALRPDNLFWFFFHVPFALLALPRFFGISGVVGYLPGWWLLYVLNGYWYLVWRTLMRRSIAYLSIPFLLYGAFIYFGIFCDEDNTWLFDVSLSFGRSFCAGSVLSFFSLLAAIVVLFVINQRMQSRSIYEEIARKEHVTKARSLQIAWLNHFGRVGQLLKLEIKSTIRNKVPRTQFLMGVCYMLLFCGLFAFTNVYDGMPFMRIFICVYCFACYGTMTLTTIMCAEGNYMDFLMLRNGLVLDLLKAKYYFNCMMTIVPLLFTLLPIFQGKVLLIEALACAAFTMGCIFPFLFQLAIYNKFTIHLNHKITRGSGRSTKIQMLFSFVALILPMLLIYVLMAVMTTVCSDSVGIKITAWIVFTLGIIGCATHKWWIGNIYRRFMIRRYENMDGFRNSRQA